MPRLAAFFSSRWRAEVPMGVLFWRDLVVVGTLLNLLVTALAFAIVAAGGAIELAVALHFTPLPYNLFLVAAVSRKAAASGWFWASLVWLVVVTLV